MSLSRHLQSALLVDSSSAHRREQHTVCGFAIPHLQKGSLNSTIRRCGSVSGTSLASCLTRQRGSWAASPLHLGGLGIRSVSCTAHAAHWGQFGQTGCRPFDERHSNIAEIMSEALSNPPATAVHLQGVVQSRSSLATVGFTTPDWNSLLQGLRPRQPELDELDPGVPSHGWQFFAALSVEPPFSLTFSVAPIDAN